MHSFTCMLYSITHMYFWYIHMDDQYRRTRVRTLYYVRLYLIYQLRYYGTHDYIDGDYARITITSWQNKLKYYTYQNTVTMVRLLYCLHYLKSISYYFQHFLVFYNINGLAKNHCVPKLMVESRTTRLFFSAATSST